MRITIRIRIWIHKNNNYKTVWVLKFRMTVVILILILVNTYSKFLTLTFLNFSMSTLTWKVPVEVLQTRKTTFEWRYKYSKDEILEHTQFTPNTDAIFILIGYTNKYSNPKSNSKLPCNSYLKLWKMPNVRLNSGSA